MVVEKCIACLERNIVNKLRKLCDRCNVYFKRTGKLRPIDTKSPLPRGTGCLRKDGYKVIQNKNLRHHPNATRTGRMLEHVYIMSIHLNRPLMDHETVHHINGIRDDNRIENLELWVKNQTPGQRLEEKIEYCINFLKKYGYKISK